MKCRARRCLCCFAGSRGEAQGDALDLNHQLTTQDEASSSTSSRRWLPAWLRGPAEPPPARRVHVSFRRALSGEILSNEAIDASSTVWQLKKHLSSLPHVKQLPSRLRLLLAGATTTLKNDVVLKDLLGEAQGLSAEDSLVLQVVRSDAVSFARIEGQQQLSFKICVMGESGVGKTLLMQRLQGRGFLPVPEPTIGAAFISLSLEADEGTAFSLGIWDCAGQQRFRSLMPMYYRAAAGVLLVFDLTDEGSFRSVPRWVEEIRRAGSPAIVLLGNKADRVEEQVVGAAEIQELASRLSLLYLEVSATVQDDAWDALQLLAGEIMDAYWERQAERGTSTQHSSLLL